MFGVTEIGLVSTCSTSETGCVRFLEMRMFWILGFVGFDQRVGDAGESILIIDELVFSFCSNLISRFNSKLSKEMKNPKHKKIYFENLQAVRRSGRRPFIVPNELRCVGYQLKNSH